MEHFEALYNDGLTARTHSVRVRIGAAVLDIFDGDGRQLDQWPGEDVRLIREGGRSDPLRLHCRHNELARLTVENHAVLPVLRAACPGLTQGHRLDRGTTLRIAGWTVVGVLSTALFVWFLIPQFAIQIAGVIPQSIQSRLGANISDQLVAMLALAERKRPEQMRCAAAAGAGALDALVARLAAGQGAAPQSFHVRVVNSPIVNAFALPGGHILLPRGMIGFAASPQALAGVVAHEMGHIELRHPLEKMLETAGVSLLFSLLVGDIAGGTVIVAVGERMIRGRYSRAAEREADLHAVRLLAGAGIDARPVAAMFERLMKKHGDPEGLMRVLSTHPPNRERVAAIRRAARAKGRALSPRQWRALKKICG